MDLSQKYLADVLGENWQDEYYVWDCAAGTGNLLNGLTNKYRIWASTLDQQDVDVMKDRIKNGANLLEEHVFQFDFLNDEFDCGKLPADLLAIIQNPEKRKKLVIYINPPYAEAGNARTPTNTGHNKSGVANKNLVYRRYKNEIKKAAGELYALFLTRIYAEMPSCPIAEFSTLKILQSANFSHFRSFFRASLEKIFLVSADTFDNVQGGFPIGFKIWRTDTHSTTYPLANVYDRNANFIMQKYIHSPSPNELISQWIKYFPTNGLELARINPGRNDFQHNQLIRLAHQILSDHNKAVTPSSLLCHAIYISVRHSIAPSWLNDRDQFLYPKDGWQTDCKFQNNCLAFTLFHTQNRITSCEGTNHWIPFTEQEVNAHGLFESHFMTDFIAGRCLQNQKTKDERRKAQSEGKKKSKKEVGSLLHLAEEESFVPTEPLEFSPEATAVFDAGRELWRYYHAQPNANLNASYYEIREHFQGRNEKGKMNPKSENAEYMRLLANLKEAMEVLRQQIVPKVYEYQFLVG